MNDRYGHVPPPFPRHRSGRDAPGGWAGRDRRDQEPGHIPEDSSMGRHSDDGLFRSPNPHRLYRNTKDGKLAGVCAGLGDYVNVDTWIVRVAVVLGLIFFTIPTLIGYVVLALALKPKPVHLYVNAEEEMFWRSVTIKPDQTLAGLRAKFRKLDQEIAGLESYVASREFDLNRQFRDLEKK